MKTNVFAHLLRGSNVDLQLLGLEKCRVYQLGSIRVDFQVDARSLEFMFKVTVPQDFFILTFFINLNPLGPLFDILKYF